jgi:uncharacterized protein (TIGR04255 family)
MLFPDSERVIYDKNPLIQVICQLRFPAILKIDSELPVEFQERIRHKYPIFREKATGTEQIPQEFTQQLPPAIVSSLFGGGNKASEFVTDDDLWVVTLTRDFLALTSNQYKHWEQFKEHLQEPFAALQGIYGPAYFSRVGLRYQNVIQRSQLALSDSKWSDLINPSIAGELSDSEIATAVQETATVTLLNLGDSSGQVRIRHGLAKNNENNEQCYMIDSDFFTDQRTEVENGINILNTFNSANRRLFRWCITDKLHDAMEPGNPI